MNLIFWKSFWITILLFWIISPVYSFTINCDETADALTPAPLEAEWAIEWWMPRHEEKLKEHGRESAKLLFLGDSITHGWENAGKETWDKYYSGLGAYNIGFSGDRTENVLWRLQHGEADGINPEVAILMIGTNNTGHRQDSPDCTARGIEMILDELNTRLPNTKVLLLAIFPRSESPNDELRQLNQNINSKIEKFAEREFVTFLDINRVFLNDDGLLSGDIMPDRLHPNEYGYQLWAEAMDQYLQTLLDE